MLHTGNIKIKAQDEERKMFDLNQKLFIDLQFASAKFMHNQGLRFNFTPTQKNQQGTSSRINSYSFLPHLIGHCHSPYHDQRNKNDTSQRKIACHHNLCSSIHGLLLCAKTRFPFFHRQYFHVQTLSWKQYQT